MATQNKPLQISLCKWQRPVMGVDIGGTKVSVLLADAQGLRGRLSEPTAKEGESNALAMQVSRLIHASCHLAQVPVSDVVGVGVSACGPFVLRDGLVELAGPNICGGLSTKLLHQGNSWTTAEIEAPLRVEFGSVRVENDGIAALEAERRWGALQGVKNCAYVTWSTGIGVGLCVDGRVLRGKNGNAGHAGHTFVSDQGDTHCGCGLVGDLESLVAGRALARRFLGEGYADAAALFEALGSGDARAQEIVDDLCELLGRGLFNLTVTLDLERISLGGSVFSNNAAYLLPRLQRFFNGKLPALTVGVQLVPAGLGQSVGDCAALALVVD
jgi:glucokinase